MLAREDISTPATLSGMPYAVYTGMQEWAEVVRAFPVRMPIEYAYTPLVWFHRWRGRGFSRGKALGTARQRARHARRLEAREPFDFWVMPMLDLAAFIEGERPVVTFHDAPYTQLMGLYDDYARMIEAQKRDMWTLDRAAAARADVIVYASDWAARWAIERLGAAPEKVRVIPFGANIEPLPADEVDAVLDQRLQGPPRILFIGADWQRKGGPLVLRAFELLKARLPELELHLVGRIPIAADELPAGAHNHGFLSLGDPAQRARRDWLYRSCSVLAVPSEAEALGIVFCEAAALAMPPIGRAVGGIPTVIDDNVNGRLVSPAATPDELAATIEAVIASPAEYRRLARAAYRHYAERLNWRRFNADLRDAVLSVLDGSSGATGSRSPAATSA
jgi:glycosyltransferase involved in cell wall biosynthesis